MTTLLYKSGSLVWYNGGIAMDDATHDLCDCECGDVCCDLSGDTVYIKWESPCGTLVVNPETMNLATPSDITNFGCGNVPNDGRNVWYTTFESSSPCDAHLDVFVWCNDDSTMEMAVCGYLNDGYSTPVNCGNTAGSVDCTCPRIVFTIDCTSQSCCSSPITFTVYNDGCY